MKAFVGDVEDLIRWMNDFKTGMRASGPMGALPDTAQKQFDKFMVCYLYVLFKPIDNYF